MDIISKRKWFLGFSGLIVVLSVISIFVFGFNAGIDLVGGAQWEISSKSISNEQDLSSALKEISGHDVMVVRSGEGFLIRLPDTNEETHQTYLVELTKKFGAIEEQKFSSIGPAIGSELRKKSIFAIIGVLLGISLYVAWAFRKVSQPIRSWKYGVVTLVTLLHDVLIPAGVLAVLGYLKGIEIDTNFIVALLTIMGFSVHDTIVVFDRIRENIMLMRGKSFSLAEVINTSVKSTMVRSINTSLTLVVVLVAMMIFGPSSLFYFIMTILIGTIFGTYSSIFLASPLLYVWQQLDVNRRQKAKM